MESLGSSSASNVFLYVGDAVRWDSRPMDVMSRGISAKTVASSIHTPCSFPSILSGLHPPQHQCMDFSDQLHPEISTLLNFSGFSTAFANSVNEKFRPTPEMGFVLDEVLNTSTSSYEDIRTLEPPFIFVERGPGGHSPYGEYDGDAWEYYRDRGAISTTQYRDEYRESVKTDSDHFASQVEMLSDRGLLDDTIVVYTSDHGELLGEGGCIGHNEPIHEKLVYVPTVFIHPEYDGGRLDGHIRHVDLFPTIQSILGVEGYSHSGIDLTKRTSQDLGATYYTKSYLSDIPLARSQLLYESAWDSTGGYVFRKSSFFDNLLVLLGKLSKGAKREYMRKHVGEVILHFFTTESVYGMPRFSKQEANTFLDKLGDLPTFQKRKRELDDAAAQRLRELGYMQG